MNKHNTTFDFSKNPLLRELLVNVFNFTDQASQGRTLNDNELNNIYRGLIKKNDLALLFDTERWIKEKAEYEAALKLPKAKVELSKIQWTGATWNPWHGCKKVSEGCKFCYMYRDKQKYGQDATMVNKSKTKFKEPLKWKEPQLVFTCSWSDWFIEEADEWRAEAWEVIKNTPQHHYQILTKRPERILECLPDDWGNGYPNVWLGVSVESNKVMHRVETLANVPAKIRFISAEPLIGEVNLMPYSDILCTSFHWIIIGGESGNDNGDFRYRPCELSWIESLIAESRVVGLDVFVKQLGTYLSKQVGCKDRHAGEIDEWPQQVQVREFPIDVSRFNLDK